MTPLQQQGRLSKLASRTLSTATPAQKNDALESIAATLWQARQQWLDANALDLQAAHEAEMRASLVDRLTLNEDRIHNIVEAVRQVAALPDPIGRVHSMETRPNGLVIGRKSVPLGVIGIIFEARPNVTVDGAVLCLKSGNTVILRGGKEAIHSNRTAATLMRQAIAQVGLDENAIQLVQDTSRESANELMHMNDYLDVLIPRGGAGLIRTVSQTASVPVIRTGEGVCHIYIDKDAELTMGAQILTNAKCSRPSVCNAAECVLVHQDVAADFLAKAIPMLDEYNVTLRCDAESLAIIGSRGEAATDEDWDSEYGDYTLAVKVVSCTQEAMDFIADHGSGHSEAIVTSNYFTAQTFLEQVDAAAVYVNASTRFTDGGEFGLGAEIGISTQKLHARGPMGLEELTSSKFIIYGQGQIR
ncbi:glutamate-5-semialdehyde dehydrogenase [Bengtsoniella intestinalis]|uniref:glutamate-5-semialdehyde dehydrogenase n=1 Tax=Bengtsoniella intestinalis TaxID=3073143 RepID=UPI00391F4F86